MALPASDPFSGSGALSASWTVNNGSFNQTTGAVFGATGSTYNRAFWNADVFGNDQYSKGIASPDGAEDFIGLMCRAAAGVGVVLEVYSGGWYIWSVPDGSNALKTLATGVALGTNDEFELRVIGTTARAYKNSVEVGSGVSISGGTFPASGGAAGIMLYTTSSAFQSWEGGNVGGGLHVPRLLLNQAVQRAATW